MSTNTQELSENVVYALNPDFRKRVFDQTQLKLAKYCHKELKRYCLEELFPGSEEPTFELNENEIAQRFEENFGYTPNTNQISEYPSILTERSFEHLISDLATGKLTGKTLILLHFLFCRYLTHRGEARQHSLPKLEQLFFAIDREHISDAQLKYSVKSTDQAKTLPAYTLNLEHHPEQGPKISVSAIPFFTAPEGNQYREETTEESSSTPINPSTNTYAAHSLAPWGIRPINQRIAWTALLLLIGTVVLVIVMMRDSSPQIELDQQLATNTPIDESKLYDLIKLAKENVAHNPTDPKALYQYANLLDQINQYQTAKLYYLKVIDQQPSHLGARNNLARLNILTGQASVAAADLQALLSGDQAKASERIYLQKNLAWAFLDQGLLQHAESTLDHIWLTENYQQFEGIEAAAFCLQALINNPMGKPWRPSAEKCLAADLGSDHDFIESQWVSTLREWTQ